KASGLRPYNFTYPERKLTMKDMLYKFIGEGKCEHGEMRAITYPNATNSLSSDIKEGKKEDQQKKFLENLKQIHINLPFIEALAQMPKYAKFLKGLLTNKARLEEACTITMNERCSAVLLNHLPSKEKDPGSFIIPCDIGQLHINNALADLGASIKAQELLGNNEPDSFLSRGLEKSIDQSDLEGCELVECNTDNKFNEPIRRIATPNEIDEKKPELKYLPHHLEYAYLHGEKSFPIIISSELSDKEKISLLQVLEKQKGAIAWKMSDIKGISPSYWTHKILMEDDFKPVIQP
ncbi:hypothetical protein Tco_0524595, partial [Tanacetum coccineum]